MIKYTTSKEANKKVQEDTDIINKIILKHFDVISIIMFGGFGHGEGAYKKVRGKIIPLNDYDLYLITEKKISDDELERVGEECSRALGKGGIEFVEEFNDSYDENKNFHVDLHCAEYSNLHKLLPTQRTFDLKTSIVIYGDKNVLKRIPDVKISKSDAIRLLFNKLDHFAIAEKNSDTIKSIYAVKGFTDLCTSLLIWNDKYTSSYARKSEMIQNIDVPAELKRFVKKATDIKLNKGYQVKNVDKFFEQSKKWVEWTLKTLLKDWLNINSDNWNIICKEMYNKLPYIYFNDYLKSRYFFPAQYYLNIKFFFAGLRKYENLVRSLFRWRDAGLILAISLILYSFGEKKGAEKYLSKLTSNTKPLRNRILKIYSIYYLQKLI